MMEIAGVCTLVFDEFVDKKGRFYYNYRYWRSRFAVAGFTRPLSEKLIPKGSSYHEIFCFVCADCL